MIAEVSSAWQETGLACQSCGGAMYSDGASRPQCPQCLTLATDEEIYASLVSLPVFPPPNLAVKAARLGYDIRHAVYTYENGKQEAEWQYTDDPEYGPWWTWKPEEAQP